jgi:hypothetical protein
MPAPARALENPLPHNPEAERSVLGAILIDNASIASALKQISSGDFFHDSHRRIFRQMITLTERAQPIDLVTLVEALYQNADLEASGGAAYIASLGDGMPKVSNVEHYAKIIREKARLRHLIHLSNNIQQLASEPDADLESLKTKLHGGLSDADAQLKIVGGNGHLRYSAMEFLGADFPVPEHLVEGLIPKEGTVMVFALPHSLKSWFTLGLAIASTCEGLALGKLEVRKPVRTLLIQVEDFPGQLQWRMREILKSETFRNWNPDNLNVIPRCGLNLPDARWQQNLMREIEIFKPDHIIFDVLRRIFRGNINDPKETGLFLEQIDSFREKFGCTTTLVHHENRKQAEIMLASAGSYNLPGWANVMIQFKRKTERDGITRVEMEVDNKLAPTPEPMSMVLDLGSVVPLRMEPLEEGMGMTEAEERLGNEWTVKELADVSNFDKTTAFRRIKKWIQLDKVEKVSAGKRGRSGGLARYRFVTGV